MGYKGDLCKMMAFFFGMTVESFIRLRGSTNFVTDGKFLFWGEFDYSYYYIGKLCGHDASKYDRFLVFDCHDGLGMALKAGATVFIIYSPFCMI